MAAAAVIAAMLLALAPVPAETAAPTGDDIVVVAAKEKCRVRFADRDMSDGEFRRRAAEWAAGKPVRVVARRSTDIKCLSKIAFRLADHGVKRIDFVEPKDVAPGATPLGELRR